MNEYEERVVRLEQWARDHLEVSEEAFKRNDAKHEELTVMIVSQGEQLDRIETMILKKEQFVLGAVFILGAIGGMVIALWDWLINRFGHG